MVGGKKAKSIQGGILIETVVFVPVVLLLFSGILSFGRLFLDSQTISRVAYEGVRFAAKTPGIELAAGKSIGKSCSAVTSITYNSHDAPTGISATAPSPCSDAPSDFPVTVLAHIPVHTRVNYLVALYKLKLDPSNPWETSLTYDAVLNKVTVSIRARAEIIGLKNLTIPFTVSQTLTYLAN